uniref:ribosomal protein L20 n=1 Tax=Caulacanthus ustulatus TaxID=31411 RepID=UPI00300139F4|nr:ribosomal protein L20 [Caulacanthus ustulatus]
MIFKDKKKEILRSRSRRLKKRSENCLNLKRINLNDSMYYNRLHYFMKLEKILLNKKVVVYFLNTEKGSIFSLKNWFATFMQKSY